MKGGLVAATAVAFASGAVANPGHRHAHDLFHKRGGNSSEVCVPGCSTVYWTVTGEPTLYNPPPTQPTTSSSPAPVTTSVESTTTSEVIPLPTPHAYTCPTPGTYTVPATTVTVHDTTTVCGATSSHVPVGTHTVGGVTTVVETQTTVTCPVATVSTNSVGEVTSTIVQTTYVCPSAGTYTVAPTTTTVTEECTITYVVPSTIAPGTYTAPETTVTATETDYVYYCPFTSSAWSTSTAVPTHEATHAPPPPPPPATTTHEAPKPAAPSPKPQQPHHTTPSGGSGLGSNTDHYGMAYSPFYPTSGDCKSPDAIDKDIKELKEAGFSIIRVYSPTDCSGAGAFEAIGKACEAYGMEMIVGIFIGGGSCDTTNPDIKAQVDALAHSAFVDITKLVIVGNEAIFNKFCQPSQLAALVEETKQACSSYTCPFTIAETVDIWQQEDVKSAICDSVGIVGANVHAYFNWDIQPSGAGKFVADQMDILDNICPGKTSLNVESGWPNAGGDSRTNEQDQAAAIQSLREVVGGRTIFLSMYNDEWKPTDDYERHWGCFDHFFS